MNLMAEEHLLECKAISYMSTLSTRESWFTRLYKPPLIAQFLKEISLTAKSGEIHGIVGVSGSGKSTLLDVMSARAQGDIGGTVLLDKHLLTPRRFTKLCVFVSFRTRYPGRLSLRSLLYYHARLSLGGGNVNSEDIERTITQLMEAFDLLGYGEERLEELSESARRRALLALHLVSDPLLVIVDDILRDLDPLPSYQLMSCLSAWAKRHNRIVLVSMRVPRSDIYQLLNRLTILFFGEVFYSGYTKQLPAYFKQAGFQCPNSENPAVYYLSLATVDRETSSRYEETQEQATKLIEYFRIHCATPRENDRRDAFGIPTIPIGSTVAMCYLERPGNMAKLGTLTRRTMSLSLTRWPLLLVRLFLLPLLLFLLLSILLFRPSIGSPSLPFSAAGVVQAAILLTATTSVFFAHSSFSTLRTLAYIESSEGVYNSALALIAHLIVDVPLELLSVLLATSLWLAGASPFWSSPAPSALSSLIHLFSSLPLFFLISLYSHLLTLLLLSLIRPPLISLGIPISIVFASVVYGGGFLRHSSMSSSLLSAPAYANIFHYVQHGLLRLLVPSLANESLQRNCTRNERVPVDKTPLKEFCRWPTASSYLIEVFPDDSELVPDPSSSSPQTISFILADSLFPLLIVAILLAIVIAAYVLPKPRSVVDKFKYK